MKLEGSQHQVGNSKNFLELKGFIVKYEIKKNHIERKFSKSGIKDKRVVSLLVKN